MNTVKYVEKLYGLLELKRKAVGVKIVTTKEEYDRYTGLELTKSIHYCVAVRSAMAGHSIKLTASTSGCPGGNRALGFDKPTDDFYSGVRGKKMGLYRDETVAASVANSVPICSPDTYGLIIKPIELFEESPDVALIMATTRTMMRVFQGYTYNFGLAKDLNISGNQAVCLECTVNPLKNNGINISTLCSGTRYNAAWDDTELMVGIAFEKFCDLVDGIEKTVNPIEPDENKKRIESILKPSNNLEIEVEYGKTYYKNTTKHSRLENNND